jgi:hypothetical protein
VGALSNRDVGKFVNENFVTSYQKVGTFKIVGNNKQGGNVASYFCAPDGRVLHCVAGPVDAATYLREAKWVVSTVERLMKESKGKGDKFKELFRIAHAAKLQEETGLKVEPITWDPPDPQDAKDALTYNDPQGRSLAPKLPPPPIDGPDVRLSDEEFNARQQKANAAPGAREMAIGKPGLPGGRRVVVNNQAIINQLFAAHALIKIEKIYGTVFENVLGEKVSTKPVDVVRPFSWVDREGNRLQK